MDTNSISPGKPTKYSYLLPTYAQKDPFVFYPESYVYAVSGNPTPSGKPRPYLTKATAFTFAHALSYSGRSFSDIGVSAVMMDLSLASLVVLSLGKTYLQQFSLLPHCV